MNIKYVGPCRDYSGYGEACRHDVAALVAAGIDVTTQIPEYVMEISNFGEIGQIATDRENRKIEYDIVILHTTPNVYRRYMEPGKYHIARVFWETDKLPEEFAVNVQLCDEVWTGSKFNADAIKKAGVTKPIYVIPEAIDDQVQASGFEPFKVDHEEIDKSYKFYSIFEWTDRKNPEALLTAYFQEFQNGEDVSLTIKTYLDNFTAMKKKEIMDSIHLLKMRLALPKYPKLYLYKRLMDRTQIYRFHRTFDCFVSAHRGEGWGIPQMEAMLMENPVISTNLGGIHEYLTHGENAILLNHKMIKISRTTRNPQWYAHDQQWADVDISMLRQALRASYQNRRQAKEMGISGGQLVHKLFALPVVGGIMKTRLEAIKIPEKPII